MKHFIPLFQNLYTSPQKLKRKRLQENANDSTNDESLSFDQETSKEEENDEEDDDEPEKINKTEPIKKKVKGKPSKDSEVELELVSSDVPYDITDELYDFGNFVADQLMCLDVHDARQAQAEIRAVLTMYMYKVMRSSKEQSEQLGNKQDREGKHQTKTQDPVELLVNQSESKVNTAGPTVTHNVSSLDGPQELQPMFSFVNTSGPPVHKSVSSIVNTAGPSMAQSVFSLVNNARPQAPQTVFAHLKTAGPSLTKSGSQVKIVGPPVTQPGVLYGPLGKDFKVLNMNPGISSAASISYVVLPSATTPGFNLTPQLGNIVGVPVTQSGSTKISNVTQSGSTQVNNISQIGSTKDNNISQSGSTQAYNFPLSGSTHGLSQSGLSMISAETTIKTEDEFESSYNNVNVIQNPNAAGSGSLELKFEPDSEIKFEPDSEVKFYPDIEDET